MSRVIANIYGLIGCVEVNDNDQVQVIMGHDEADHDLWQEVASSCNKVIKRTDGGIPNLVGQIVPLQAGESVEAMKALQKLIEHSSRGQLKLYKAVSLPSPTSA